MGNIVVGVDGSDSARDALTWAIGEAKIRGREVVAVYAWIDPIVPPSIDGVIVPIPHVGIEQEAENLLEREIKEVTGGSDEVKVQRRFVRRHPVAALLRTSEDADMLVIGSRGLGGFSGLMLGSVGQQCVHHATCPVVIVPHKGR
ncbi:MAG: universal stress protein [Actinomycetota bacterium]